MVRKVIHKNKIIYALTLAVIAPLAVVAIASGASATNNSPYTCTGAGPFNTTTYTNCKDSTSASVSAGGPEVDFNVNVKEVLKVAVTVPDTWNSNNNTGQANIYCDSTDASLKRDCAILRNKYNISVVSNNVAGVTVTMTAGNANATMTNEKSSNTIPTLTSAKTASAMATGGGAWWGYSLDDADTAIGTAEYKGIAGLGADTPSPICSQSSNKTTECSSVDIYFGATADDSIDSGIYTNSVVISVVSGVINSDTNPVTPVNPATPTDTSTNNPDIAYNGTTGYTTRTARSTTTTGSGENTSTTTTTTTEVSKGNNTQAYTNPQGVTTTAKISEGTPLATGLAVTAAIAAASGLVFFIIAKRKSDDSEEEA